MACLRAKPIVDGLEDDLGDKAIFLRADLLSDVGEALGDRFGVHASPSFLAFDAQGRLVLKQSGGKVPVARLRKILSGTADQ